MEGLGGEITFMSDLLRNDREIAFPGYEIKRTKGAVIVLKTHNSPLSF